MIVWPLAAAVLAAGCSSKKHAPTVVLQAIAPVESDGMRTSATIVRNRLERLGVRGFEVRAEGRRLLIRLPSSVPPARITPAEKQGVAELYDLETSLTGPSVDPAGNPVATTDLYGLLSKVGRPASDGRPAAYYVFVPDRRSSFGPAPTKAGALLLAGKRPPPNGWRFVPVPPKTAVLTCGAGAVVCPDKNAAFGNAVEPPPSGRTYYYLAVHDRAKEAVFGVTGVPQLTASDLKLSATRMDFDPVTNEPVVLIQFTAAGSRKFQRVTAAEYARGRKLNRPQHFAIVVDGEIRSFPQIDYLKADLVSGISGNAEISGFDSRREAREIALLLATPPLPVRFVRVPTG